MTRTSVALRLEIENEDVFARWCRSIYDDETIDGVNADPTSNLSREEIMEEMELMRNGLTGALAKCLLMGTSMRNNISVRSGNTAGAIFPCAEAAERAVAEIMNRGCPPGLKIVVVSNEK